jgi:hypothetical protein
LPCGMFKVRDRSDSASEDSRMNDVYKRCPLSATLINKAKAEAQKIGVYTGSHRKQDGTLIGCIGELVVAQWLSDNALTVERTARIEHDIFVSSDRGPKARIEVKTKDRTVEPKPNFEATVPMYVYEKQRPDYYIFVSLLRPKLKPMQFTHAFIVGGLDRDTFDNRKRKEEVGYKPNGAVFWTDAWNVYISDLIRPDDLLGLLS